MEKLVFKEHIEKFLLSDITNEGATLTAIDTGTNLWDAGLVDSFRVMELILFLEDLLGKEISVESNFISNFHTVDAMYRTLVKN